MAPSTVSQFDFKNYTQVRRELVEQRLRQYLDFDDPHDLWESMRYSVLSGGKRLRSLLCIAGSEAVSPAEETVDLVLPCACAIEMVHAMSLIHDDLPCMDNDDFRRGKPTNHKVFGEALALLAGDALLMHAIDILIDKTPEQVDRRTLISVSLELARASGAKGMVAGQVDDLRLTGASDKATGLPAASNESGQSSESGEVKRTSCDDTTQNESLVASIHRRKTGALIKFAISSGARLANASDLQVKALEEFGEILGLAFQITDDLLDVTGDIGTLGKTPGKDVATKKVTWVRVFGTDGARRKLDELESQGEQLIAAAPLETGSLPALSSLLKYAIHRNN